MAEPDRGTSSARTTPAAVDAAVGVAAAATNAAVSVTRLFARAAAPVGRMVMHPPLLNESLHPARAVEAFADRGHLARTSASDDLNRIIAAVVPPVVDEVLDSLDLTALVQERVDIDALVSTVDIAAVVDRLDIDAIVRQVDIDGMLRQVDIDAIVSKVDIDAIVRHVDIDAIARQVDVDAIVSQVDIDAIAKRIDVDAIVETDRHRCHRQPRGRRRNRAAPRPRGLGRGGRERHRLARDHPRVDRIDGLRCGP